jgi:hypothetical protein
MVRANPQLPFLIFNELITNPGRIDSLKGKIGSMVTGIFSPLEARLKEEIAKGRIRPITAFDLLIDIVSLNVAFFLATPILKVIRKFSDEEFELAVEARRRENVEVILKSLRP